MVRDPRLVATFLDSRKRRLLLAFAGRSMSVSEAAAWSGQPLGRIHYHVVDLVRKGLLETVEEVRRRGRPIRRYRAVAERFFVPTDLLDRSPGAGLASELRGLLDEALFRAPDDGVLFYAEEGEPRVSWFGQNRSSGEAGEFWQILTLADSDVRAFAAEMKALMERYEARSGRGRPYLLHAAFAPRAPDG
jgi:hypothetical protein